MAQFHVSVVATLLLFLGSATCEDFYARPGVRAGEILRALGFIVEENYVISRGGYKLCVTRADNPVINSGRIGGLPNRDPILFVHGILENDSIFVINSKGASPKDFSNLDLNNATTVNQTILQDPSSRSLVILALNFGHTIYLLSRRGFPGSQQRLGDPNTIDPETEDANDPLDLSLLPQTGPITTAPGALVDYGNLPAQVRFTLNRNYWNYSYNEQIDFDLPVVFELISNQTGRPKLAIVGHSTGGTLTLGLLSTRPEFADKISAAILWAEGLSLGHGDAFNLLLPFKIFFEAYVGPIPPSFSTTQIQAFVGILCFRKLLQKTLCEGFADLVLGQSGGQQGIKPEYINTLFYPTASHEIAQNEQCVQLGGMMHKYNYGTRGNLAAYNQTSPPLYDAAKIRLDRMSFYTSTTDQLVSQADVETTVSRLTVPFKFNLIERPFNHLGYFFHDDCGELAIVPSLADIHQLKAAA